MVYNDGNVVFDEPQYLYRAAQSPVQQAFQEESPREDTAQSRVEV
jgi:hypothetical protein